MVVQDHKGPQDHEVRLDLQGRVEAWETRDLPDLAGSLGSLEDQDWWVFQEVQGRLDQEDLPDKEVILCSKSHLWWATESCS